MSHYVAFPDEDVYHAWTKAGAGGQPAILTMCGKHGRKTTREEQTYDDGSPRPEIHYGQPPEERTPCEACRVTSVAQLRTTHPTDKNRQLTTMSTDQDNNTDARSSSAVAESYSARMVNDMAILIGMVACFGVSLVADPGHLGNLGWIAAAWIAAGWFVDRQRRAG